MKKRLIALILLLALLLTGCGHVAVEDTQRRTLGSLLFPGGVRRGGRVGRGDGNGECYRR